MQELGFKSDFGLDSKTMHPHCESTPWLERPRTVFWQWLLYGKTSEFRKTLESVSRGLMFGGFAEAALPLDFNTMFEMPDDGYISRLGLTGLKDLPGDLEGEKISYQLGCVIGLWTWLGIADLDAENVEFAYRVVGEHGQIIFMPKNIECLFNEVSLPADLGITVSRAVAQQAGSLAHIKKLLFNDVAKAKGSVAALLQGYIETLALLDREQDLLKETLSGIPGIHAALIRTPSLDGRQMDGPYYVRRFDSANIMVYKGAGELEKEKVASLEKAAVEMRRYKPRVIGTPAWSSTWRQSAVSHFGVLQLAQELLFIPSISTWRETQVYCEHEFLYVHFQNELWRKELSAR